MGIPYALLHLLYTNTSPTLPHRQLDYRLAYTQGVPWGFIMQLLMNSQQNSKLLTQDLLIQVRKTSRTQLLHIFRSSNYFISTLLPTTKLSQPDRFEYYPWEHLVYIGRSVCVTLETSNLALFYSLHHIPVFTIVTFMSPLPLYPIVVTDLTTFILYVFLKVSLIMRYLYSLSYNPVSHNYYVGDEAGMTF